MDMHSCTRVLQWHLQDATAGGLPELVQYDRDLVGLALHHEAAQQGQRLTTSTPRTSHTGMCDSTLVPVTLGRGTT